MLTQLDTNDPEIWHALGDAFQNGRGIERDVELGEKYYRMAAESGHVQSMILLGLLLKRDGRSPQDLAESIQWFRRAADLGDASGMTWLGYAFSEGAGDAEIEERRRLAIRSQLRTHNSQLADAAKDAGGVEPHGRESHPRHVAMYIPLMRW